MKVIQSYIGFWIKSDEGIWGQILGIIPVSSWGAVTLLSPGCVFQDNVTTSPMQCPVCGGYSTVSVSVWGASGTLDCSVSVPCWPRLWQGTVAVVVPHSVPWFCPLHWQPCDASAAFAWGYRMAGRVSEPTGAKIAWYPSVFSVGCFYLNTITIQTKKNCLNCNV